MKKKELREYITDQGLNISDVLRLAGYSKGFLHVSPEEEVSNTILQIILSAIDLKHEQLIEELTFRQAALEKIYESKIRKGLNTYADRIAARAEMFRSLNEDDFSLDNLVDDSWKQIKEDI